MGFILGVDVVLVCLRITVLHEGQHPRFLSAVIFCREHKACPFQGTGSTITIRNRNPPFHHALRSSRIRPPLYIGFDLSTQQLNALVVTSHLRVVHIAIFDFDANSHGFPVKNGVQTHEAEQEVFAPVAMWLQALDDVLLQLKRQGLDFGRVCAISGAGQAAWQRLQECGGGAGFGFVGCGGGAGGTGCDGAVASLQS
ncbi:hypothetical protein PABG_12302 [Paracoccidioides brasiliensis Pb03]|nr:hypothetical protein PABG_12302 [Paracoccidioides brasiliensis Pb03]